MNSNQPCCPANSHGPLAAAATTATPITPFRYDSADNVYKEHMRNSIKSVTSLFTEGLPNNNNKNKKKSSNIGTIVTIPSTSNHASMDMYVTSGQRRQLLQELDPSAVDSSSSSSSSSFSSLFEYNNNVKRIIVVFSDVYGYSSGRHFQFADDLAKDLNNSSKNRNNDDSENDDTTSTTTTIVVVPDLFRGDPPMKPLSLWPFFFLSSSSLGGTLSYTRMIYKCKFVFNEKYVVSTTNDFIIPYLLNQTNKNKHVVSFSSVGFCFGTWVVAKTAAAAAAAVMKEDNDEDEEKKQQQQLWKCGVGMHPAFTLEQIHGGSEISLAKQIPGSFPYLLMPAGNDSDAIKIAINIDVDVDVDVGEGGVDGGGGGGGKETNDVNCVQIMAKARNVSQQEVSMEFPTMKHGWMTRGDPLADEDIHKAQILALQKCVEFLEKHHPVV